MAKVIVDVMPKPEILDPQGKAITGALQRLGYEGFAVRQGKRFEITVDGDIDEQRWAQIHAFADALLANTVIEAYQVRWPEADTPAQAAPDESTPGEVAPDEVAPAVEFAPVEPEEGSVA
jgi:phosphoribosylformylglycinamidine synthase PurS subunit